MSILINTEMPKNCVECPFCGEEFVQCSITKNRFFKVRNAFEKRHPNCPLAELPPHGRLIDADALKYTLYNAGAITMTGIKMLNDAPTIIEAEDEE